MKKFFLFAVAALVCTAISAQNGMKKMASPTMPAKPALQKMINGTPKALPQGSLRMAIANRNLSKKLQLTSDQLKGLKLVNHETKSFENTNVLSASFQQTLKPVEFGARFKVEGGNTDAIFHESYDGTGRDYYDENHARQSWTMRPSAVTYEDETTANVLVDMIPVPEVFASYFPDGIPVEYTLEGNTITIEPQSIGLSFQNEAKDSTFYVCIFNATSDDGIITMEIDEEGTIETGYPWIAYGALYNGAFELDDDDNLIGLKSVYALTYDVSFNGAPDDVTLTTDTEYRAYGVDDGEAQQWTMGMGTASTVKKTQSVFINLVPVPQELQGLYPEGIYVPYTSSGKTITVPAKAVAYTEDLTFFLCSGIVENGSIEFTLNDNGTIDLDPDEEIMIAAFSSEELDWSSYEGSLVDMTHIRYLAPGQKLIPEAAYEPEGLYLHIGYSLEGMGYYSNIAAIPADATVNFRNIMTDPADTFKWSVTPYGEDGLDTSATITGSSYNFSFETKAGDVYAPVELVASTDGEQSKTFTWGHNYVDSEGNEKINEETGEPYHPYVYAGYLFDDEADDGPLFVSKCNIPDDGYYIWSRYATPDQASNSLSKLVLYQGKPAGPLYFEGVNLWVHQLTMNDNFHLTCKIQKVSRNAEGRLELGDVIAQADISSDDVITSSDNVSSLEWTSFYTEDEMGMTTDLEYLQIDEEFAIVIDGWDNGTFSCTDVMGDAYNPAATYVSTFFYLTGNDEHLYYFTSYPYLHLYAGFINAIYGYLHTDDSKEITLPAEGGETTIHVKPMLCSKDDEGNRTTALWYADEEYEEPEWLGVEIDNENYETEFGFDIIISADALPEGVTGRTEELKLRQWGAALNITVTQGIGGQVGVNGDVNGDGSVDVADISSVISVMAGTAEYANADVNGDGTVDVADISSIITIMASN